MTDKPICGNCRHYRPFHDTDTGHCHRYPPQVFFDPTDEDVNEVWPLLNRNSRCGEFSAGS